MFALSTCAARKIAAAIIDGRYPKGRCCPVPGFRGGAGANPLTVAKAYSISVRRPDQVQRGAACRARRRRRQVRSARANSSCSPNGRRSPAHRAARVRSGRPSTGLSLGCAAQGARGMTLHFGHARSVDEASSCAVPDRRASPGTPRHRCSASPPRLDCAGLRLLAIGSRGYFCGRNPPARPCSDRRQGGQCWRHGGASVLPLNSPLHDRYPGPRHPSALRAADRPARSGAPVRIDFSRTEGIGHSTPGQHPPLLQGA